MFKRFPLPYTVYTPLNFHYIPGHKKSLQGCGIDSKKREILDINWDKIGPVLLLKLMIDISR